MSNSRTLKQEYLRKEILDQGYDGAAFSQFCEENYPEAGENIDSYSFDDLKKMVQQFKEKENKELDEVQNYVQPKMEFEDEYTKKFNERFNNATKKQFSQSEMVSSSNESSDTFDINKILQGQDLSQKITCKIMEKTKIEEHCQSNPNKKIQITIPEYGIKIEGFLHIQYALFKIVTKPFGWEVYRRYTDFVWLRSTLEKMFPGCIIPPLPRKKKVRSVDEYYLTKKQKVMENFLNYISEHPILRGSSYLQSFLSLNNDNQFTQAKRQADNYKIPSEVQDYTNPEGKVISEISQNHRLYTNVFNDYINQKEITYKKIKKQTKELCNDMNSASQNLYKISDCFKSMVDTVQIFNKNVPNQGAIYGQERVYLTLKEFFSLWAKNEGERMKIVKESLQDFFRFQNKMNKLFQDSLRKRNTLAAQFGDMLKKLNEKKEKLLSNEQDIIKINGQIFGHCNKQFHEDTQLYLQVKQRNYCEKFNWMQQQLAINLTEMHFNLAETMSQLSASIGISNISLNTQQQASIKLDQKAIQPSKSSYQSSTTIEIDEQKKQPPIKIQTSDKQEQDQITNITIKQEDKINPISQKLNVLNDNQNSSEQTEKQLFQEYKPQQQKDEFQYQSNKRGKQGKGIYGSDDDEEEEEDIEDFSNIYKQQGKSKRRSSDPKKFDQKKDISDIEKKYTQKFQDKYCDQKQGDGSVDNKPKK